MRTLFAALTSVLFIGSVSAASDAEIYRGFADGNPDLSNDIKGEVMPTAVQPGVGDNFDWYHGLSLNNPDLYPSIGDQSVMAGAQSGSVGGVGDAHIYHGFEVGNPDL